MKVDKLYSILVEASFTAPVRVSQTGAMNDASTNTWIISSRVIVRPVHGVDKECTVR